LFKQIHSKIKKIKKEKARTGLQSLGNISKKSNRNKYFFIRCPAAAGFLSVGKFFYFSAIMPFQKYAPFD